MFIVSIKASEKSAARKFVRISRALNDAKSIRSFTFPPRARAIFPRNCMTSTIREAKLHDKPFSSTKQKRPKCVPRVLGGRTIVECRIDSITKFVRLSRSRARLFCHLIVYCNGPDLRSCAFFFPTPRRVMHYFAAARPSLNRFPLLFSRARLP